MSDVVLTFPVVSGEEDRLFDNFFNRFTEDRAATAISHAEEAPFLMLRSDPSQDGAVKVVIFQEQDLARAFSQGWTQLRRHWTHAS